MSIEEFVRYIAVAVAQHVSQAPPKQFTVNRLDDSGKPAQQTTTLPQLIAEQNDHLRAANVLQTEVNRRYVETIEALRETTEALRRNTKMAKKVLEEQQDV